MEYIGTTNGYFLIRKTYMVYIWGNRYIFLYVQCLNEINWPLALSLVQLLLDFDIVDWHMIFLLFCSHLQHTSLKLYRLALAT